jgi:phage portal protein BeeE
MNRISLPRRTQARDTWTSGLSVDDWISLTYQGVTYGLPFGQTLPGAKEKIASDFGGYVETMKRSGVVFACLGVRLAVFSQARFAYQRLNDGMPGELFGADALELLHHPWTNATTQDLLSRQIQDADLAGNSYWTVVTERLRRLRPDWVTILIGTDATTAEMTEAELALDAASLEAEILGYMYLPGGQASGAKPRFLLPAEVAHFAPTPDPAATYRGMSWLTPVIREIAADSAATSHKLKFFENGATPNLAVKLDLADPEKFKQWKALFDEQHVGISNAYKTLYLGAGADVTAIGSDMRQLDFKVTQGAGETRIAAAAGVPPVIVGLSEGLQGSSLNAGNYSQARRRLAEGTLWPLWGGAAGSLETLTGAPESSRLWVDVDQIPFLREDRKDAAEIQGLQARTLRALVDAGFTPASAIAAVKAEDLALLEHTGLFSVQLQPPGVESSAEPGRALAELVGPYLSGGNGKED